MMAFAKGDKCHKLIRAVNMATIDLGTIQPLVISPSPEKWLRSRRPVPQRTPARRER